MNIGNPYEISVADLANIIIRLTNSKSSIVYQPLPSDDPTNRRPDITRAREILHWEPRYDLEDGIIKTIAYFSSLKE